MKIGIVIRRFSPSRGGAEKWTADLVRGLTRRGHQVHVLAERCEGEPAGFHFHRVRVTGVGRSWRYVGFCRAAAAAAARLRLDVVHDQGDGWWGNVLLPHEGTRWGSFQQNLASIRGGLARLARRVWLSMQPRYRLLAWVARRQFDPCARREWVALSQFVRRDMIEHYGVPAERVHLIYNGVDGHHFHPGLRHEHRQRVRQELGVGEDQTLFLLVGHNFRLKGLAELIEAASLLAQHRRDFRIVVAGAGRGRPYRRLAQARRCADLVHLVGKVPDVRPLYAAADVFVLPTFYDPCSLVVLEALACGLPVITSRFNGAGELMTDGREGYVIPTPRDRATLAERMATLMDGSRRSDMGAAARLLAERHPLERNHEEILGVYETAIRRSPLD